MNGGLPASISYSTPGVVSLRVSCQLIDFKLLGDMSSSVPTIALKAVTRVLSVNEHPGRLCHAEVDYFGHGFAVIQCDEHVGSLNRDG